MHIHCYHLVQPIQTKEERVQWIMRIFWPCPQLRVTKMKVACCKCGKTKWRDDGYAPHLKEGFPSDETNNYL